MFSLFIVNIIGIVYFIDQNVHMEATKNHTLVWLVIGLKIIWKTPLWCSYWLEISIDVQWLLPGIQQWYCWIRQWNCKKANKGKRLTVILIFLMINYLLITLQKISVQRQTSLGAMFAYNKSDWTYGWMAAFDGFTVFYAEVNSRLLQKTVHFQIKNNIYIWKWLLTFESLSCSNFSFQPLL